MQTRRLVLLVFLFGALLTANAAPNLSGKWKFNKDKSDMGAQSNIGSLVWEIDHKEPKISIRIAQDELDLAISYFTDGREGTGTGFGDAEPKGRAEWKGDKLQTKVDMGEQKISSSWSLSADGKVLTIERVREAAMGNLKQKMVFEKQ